MRERESVARGGFIRKNGVLVLTGLAAVGLIVFAASGVRSHNHGAGASQHAHAGCGVRGDSGHAHGECSDEGSDKDEDCKLEKACPLLKGGEEDGNCPVKKLIGNKVVCPVMENNAFVVTDNTIAVEHEGRIYLLCCPPCEGRFKADPEAYTGHQAKADGHEGHRHNH